MNCTWNVWSGLQNCLKVFFSESTTKNKSLAQFLASQSEISIFGSTFRKKHFEAVLKTRPYIPCTVHLNLLIYYVYIA